MQWIRYDSKTLQMNTFEFLNNLFLLDYRKYLSFCLFKNHRRKDRQKAPPNWPPILQLLLHTN
jgi:hypothetical protein